MSKCGRILNRHKWYKYHVKGSPPPTGYAQSYTTYRVCRKCGALQKQYIEPGTNIDVSWLGRGTIPDFEKVIEYYESKKLKKRNEQHAIETAVHQSSEFIPSVDSKED